MSIGKDGAAYRRLRVLYNAGAIRELSDGQLLERFATARDESAELAFAALVERHGPMVLRVCRGVLADPHDAQDAFQATFLVLVRKARGLWVRDSLGPWLHQVAYRAASGARATAARRNRLERMAAKSPEQAGAGAGDEVVRLLHEEIERLPERYRAPVILCDLEGRTHEQAARHLGWPIGTVKSRQSRARERLRERLTKRGLAPDSGRPALLPIPPALVDITARAAVRFLATRAIAPGSVAMLAQGVLRTMILFRCLKVGSAFLALGATTTGVALITQDGPSQANAKPSARAEAPTVKVGPGKLRVTVSGRGNVEASKTVDLLCEIEGGTTIIQILPEGSSVKKGDVLARLDETPFRDRLLNQEVAVKGATNAYQRSLLGRETAEYAAKEYTEGIYKQEWMNLKARIQGAQSGIERAGARLERVRKAHKRLVNAMAPRGGAVSPSEIVAELQVEDLLESAELGVTRERLSMEQAQTSLDVLEKYTRDRTIRELEGVVLARRADERDRQNALELEKSKAARLERQIEACKLLAPIDGTLIYAPNSSGTGPIEEGATVRERQRVVSVFDLNGPMTLKVMIPEAVIDRLRGGLKARIGIDAVPNMSLEGKVEGISPLPDRALFSHDGRNVYMTRVGIGKNQLNLRPGMSGEVEILVSELHDILTVPISAVVHFGEKDHVGVKLPGGGIDWREVTLGMTDDKVVEVKQGLKAGEVVAVDPLSLMSDEEKRRLCVPIPPNTPG